MATFQSTWDLLVAAMDDLADNPNSGLTRLSVLLQSTITQAQYDAAVQLAADRKTALTAVLADLDAADVADATEGAANTSGDLARAAARLKINQAA